MRLRGRLPPFVGADTSRDFVYIDDAIARLPGAAVLLRPDQYGESFNIGSGVKTTIRELAHLAKREFHLDCEPEFSTMPARAGTSTTGTRILRGAAEVLGWRAEVGARRGLGRTARWYAGLADVALYERASKKRALDSVYSVTVIIACYKDGQAIPVMAERLERMFAKTRHRLRDHLRERRQPGRFRGSDPRLERAGIPACSASRTRAISARRRRFAAAWSSPRRMPWCSWTAICRIRRN